MKLLAIETSSTLCGACLCEDEKIIDKIELENGLTHSQNLMPIIQELLNKNNIKINEINYFICDIGPGSFTGIRIGVATTLAFKDCFENSIYTGISSLEALAYNIKTDGYIASIIDCKNNNCYFALYDLQNNEYNTIIPPTALSIEELFNKLATYTQTITFVGDGVDIYKNDIAQKIPNAKFADEFLNKIKTENLALAGLNRINSNSKLELLPLYLKKPQAQKQLEEKQGKN